MQMKSSLPAGATAIGIMCAVDGPEDVADIAKLAGVEPLVVMDSSVGAVFGAHAGEKQPRFPAPGINRIIATVPGESAGCKSSDMNYTPSLEPGTPRIVAIHRRARRVCMKYLPPLSLAHSPRRLLHHPAASPEYLPSPLPPLTWTLRRRRGG